jgi:hypothetical protein
MKITNKNFRTERGVLIFTVEPTHTFSDEWRIASRDSRFHKWTMSGMKKFLVKWLNNNNFDTDLVAPSTFDAIFKSQEFIDWVNPQVPSWMRK